MKYSRKIKLFGIAMACVLVSTTSCKKYLDINTSPVTATSVDPKLLFGYSVAAWSSYRNAGDIYFPLVFAHQSIADGNTFGWDAGDVYDLSPTSMNNVWRMYYNISGNNLQLAIAQAKTNNSPNTEAQCKVILANLVYETTTLFGDVPFSEAWNPNISYPKFDAQEDVLNGALAIVDDALTLFDEASASKISDYDVFYAGNIAKWKKLANSIKLKILFTMVDKDPTKAAAIGTLVSNPANLIASAAENMEFKYKTTTNNENPKYRLLARYTNGENQWFFAHKNILDYMKPVNDPRIPKYFDLGDGETEYKGLDTRELADAKSTLISAYLFRKDCPDVMCSYQEVLFYQAEAYARGLGVTANLTTANTLYKKGIEEACKYYGVDATAAATFATGLPALASVQDIHIQQWVDFMDRPVEAFVQYRRSGVEGSETPNLTFPADVSVGTKLFRRFTYPSAAETNTNVNKPDVIPVYSDKMWFDL